MADKSHPQHGDRTAKQYRRCWDHALWQSSYVVASPLWKVPEGQAKWDGPGGNTEHFTETTYVTQRDPQWTNTALVAASLSGFCTLNALAMRVDAEHPVLSC